MAAKKLVSMRLSEEADSKLSELAEESGVTESEILAQAIKDIYAKRQEEKRLKTLSDLAAATCRKYLPDNPMPGWEGLWVSALIRQIENIDVSILDLLYWYDETRDPADPDFEKTKNWLIENITEPVNKTMTEAIQGILIEYLQELFSA